MTDILTPPGGNWNSSVDSLYLIMNNIINDQETRERLLGSPPPPQPIINKWIREALIIFHEVRHDFSKADQFTDKRGILFWGLSPRTPTEQIFTQSESSNDFFWNTLYFFVSSKDFTLSSNLSFGLCN